MYFKPHWHDCLSNGGRLKKKKKGNINSDTQGIISIFVLLWDIAWELWVRDNTALDSKPFMTYQSKALLAAQLFYLKQHVNIIINLLIASFSYHL